MENGIGIAEDAKLGEMNSVNSEELEPSVKESVQLSSDGSKESDEDEVFEEAIEPPPTIGSGYSTMAGGGDSKLIGSLENKEGNSDVFHEAVGTPSAAESLEVAWVKTHTFDDDKPIATETIVTGERNGLMDDIAADKNDRDVDEKKDNYKEIVDSAATADETENFEGGNEELEKSNQKPEDDVSDKKRTFLEVLTTGDAKTADADNREEQVLEISESLEPDELISTETDPKKLEIGELPHELSEVHDSNKIEGDKSSETPVNGSLSHGSLVGTLNNECLKIESADAPKEQTYETPSEIEGVHKSESESSGDVLHKNEENAILGYGDQQDETNVDDKKDNYKEIVDSAATAGVTENLEGGNEELEKSNQKPEDDVLDKKRTFLEVLTTGDADNREEQVLEISESLEPDELISTETDPKKLEIGELPHELSEVQDSNKIEGDNSSETPENGSLSHGSLVGTLNHECLKIVSAEAPKEQTYETPSEIEGGHRSESESNGDILHKNEENAILGYGDQQDECGIESVSLHPELKDVDVGEEEKSCISSANVKDEKTAEQKKLDLELVQGERVDKQAVDQEENRSSSASDTSTIDHSKESCGLDTQLHSAVADSKLVMERAEIEPHFSLPELLVESSRSQPNIVDSSAKVSTNVIERPEQGVVEGEKKDLSLLGNKKEDVTPVAGISSSSGNSSISGLSPARPASFSDVVKMKEPVPQDTAKAKPETKPAVDISSGNTITPPAGLGHAGPLPEPASQNKDSRSRSTADTQSRNITSATPTRPAGLGRAAPLLEPASRVVQQPRVNGAFSAAQNQLIEDSTNGEAEEYDETREKLQMIRVKFLRLAHRLGQTPHNVVVAQVLYRLGLAEQLHGRSGGRVAAFSFDRASAMAEQLEAAGQEPLDFTCTIMVLGKSGVGKSATINSIFDEAMFGTDAFELGTKKVQDVVGTVQGIRVRVIDTPGLLPSWSDQRENERILHSVKKFIKKTPPDIILYLDRLDMQSRDFSDMPLLRTITEIFGPSIWFNAIVVLTHAASAPPEGPNGTATSYDMFVTQRSLVVQQAIRQAAGDMRLMNPVSLVENHSACRTNRAGQRVLPNGQVWKPHLLLLSFASKILAEANTLLKLQDTPPGRPFAPRARTPPLPFLLSSLLQSRPEVKLPSEQFGDDDDPLDDDMDDCSDSEEESEYDVLPPFKSLTKAQLEKLSKVQRKAYYDELEYREKLFMKKQLKEERKRRKMMKRMEEAVKNLPAVYGDNSEEESNAAASVPVPIPDLTLPASFDSDNPTYRYRSLDSSNTWLVRAVLEPNGWDHDIGYDGINVEKLFVVKDKVPISFSGHISKDKKDANLQMEVASSVKHGKGKATSLGFDMQSVGKDYAYTLRGETRFSNHRINKATAGLSATVLGDVLTGGIKLEDKLIIGKRGQLVVSGGAIYGRGEVAYGGSLEAILKDKDHPLGRFSSTLGLSIMDWQGDVSIGCNSQTQIPIGRHTNLIGRFNISNRGSGQFSVRLNSSEQLQIVLIGLIPLVKKIMGYSQQAQYG